MLENRMVESLLLLILGSTGGMPLSSQAATDVGGEITLGSDYVFRGVSQTMSSPTLQGTFSVENEAGWYGYLWASNVDFTDHLSPSDGASLEINVEGGYWRGVTERISLSVGWVYYAYPGTRPGYDYDYDEWLGSLIVDARHRIDIGVSSDVFGSGRSGTFLSAGTGLELAENFSIDLTVGHYDLQRAYEESYSYAEIAASGISNRVDWRLSYMTTDRGADVLFEESTVGERVVLTFSLAF